jgi:hypothetical protein
VNPALVDIWLEKLRLAGDDEEEQAEVLTEIYEQGQMDSRREDAARPEEY